MGKGAWLYWENGRGLNDLCGKGGGACVATECEKWAGLNGLDVGMGGA